MENFTYLNPTRIHFGRGQIAAIDRELPAGAGPPPRGRREHPLQRRAGAGPQGLGGRPLLEFFGVEANPDFDTLMRAVEIVPGRKGRLDPRRRRRIGPRRGKVRGGRGAL
jgi:NADP-dependent alcohol dehydrogenase